MSTNVFSPAVPEKAKDILLGEGAAYKNLDEDGEALIGATRGGSRLEMDWVKGTMEYDGAIGPTQGMRRSHRLVPKLIINFLKLSYINLAYGLNVTISDGADEDGTYKKISFDTDFASTDVLTNVGFKGYKASGEYCKCKVENALNIDSITLEFNEKDEVVGEITYTGFYPYATPTIPPMKIDEEDAS